MTQLQRACDEILGVQLRLADHFLELGLLVIWDRTITEDMFRVACVAHELFSMVAVDIAHRDMVYPHRDRKSILEEKNFVQGRLVDWPKDVLESWRQWQIQRTKFESEIIRRVRAVRDQQHMERTNPSTS